MTNLMRRLGLAAAMMSLLVAMTGRSEAGLSFDNGADGSGPSNDPPLIVNGGWQGFQFGSPGTFNFDGPFTFTSSITTDLKVTDAFLKGDSFAVYDNGALLGATTVVPPSMINTTSNPDLAFFDPTYSHGEFLLSAGSHSIRIQTVNSPFGGGAGFLRADTFTAVPEPSSLALTGIAGVLGLGYARSRRKPTAA